MLHSKTRTKIKFARTKGRVKKSANDGNTPSNQFLVLTQELSHFVRKIDQPDEAPMIYSVRGQGYVLHAPANTCPPRKLACCVELSDNEPMELDMSTLTFAATGRFQQRIRFVLVNDRVPRRDADCALCGSKIEKGYVRESQTHLFYCDTQCFAGHAIAIKNHARKAAI
jgi:ribosomal protein L24E